uniref:Uncharacterized protein n=1 Tax=Monodelphis domestica TaxID=13616 RepID=A0A5F8H329_MONDO
MGRGREVVKRLRSGSGEELGQAAGEESCEPLAGRTAARTMGEKAGTRVFKKSSPNCKLTVYLGKRDFVDHLDRVDPVGAKRRSRLYRGTRQGLRLYCESALQMEWC